MRKKTAATISCLGALLLIGALPLLVRAVTTRDFHGKFCVNYLSGLSTILGWTGAESCSFHLDRAAGMIEHDLHPVVVSFRNKKEETLISKEAERIEPRIWSWGGDLEVMPSGDGVYRFYLPPSEFSDFEQAIAAYKRTLESGTEQAGRGDDDKPSN